MSSSNSEVDTELAAAMDMPIHNDEAKYFLADFHKDHNLEFKPTPIFAVNLDLPHEERWKEVVEHHMHIMPRVQASPTDCLHHPLLHH